MLLFPFFQRSLGFVCLPLLHPVTRVSKRIAKVQAFINSVQIFLPFSEDLFPRTLPENLSKNYTFLKRAAKVALFANSTKSFFHFPIPIAPYLSENYRSLKSGRQRYNEYFYHQSFSLKNFPFCNRCKGICFKTGGKDRSPGIAAKYFWARVIHIPLKHSSDGHLRRPKIIRAARGYYRERLLEQEKDRAPAPKNPPAGCPCSAGWRRIPPH